jgi:hypothetical protein
MADHTYAYDDESECESLPDDADDHTTGYLMPDGRLVVIDDEPVKVEAPTAQVTLSPTPKMTDTNAKPEPKTKVVFVIERTEYLECRFDREDFTSLFEDAYDDPATTPADKAKLNTLTEKVWQQLIERKKMLQIKEETPMLRVAEQDYGYNWVAEYPGDQLKKVLLKTYKGLGELMTRLGHDDD